MGAKRKYYAVVGWLKRNPGYQDYTSCLCVIVYRKNDTRKVAETDRKGVKQDEVVYERERERGRERVCVCNGDKNIKI